MTFRIIAHLNSRIGPEFVDADANISKKETKNSLRYKKQETRNIGVDRMS